MKKLTKSLALILMCMLMLVSSASLSMASAIGNVKTLVLNSATVSGVSIQWSSVSGAKGYRVYRYAESEKAWKTLKNTTSRSYNDTAVKPGEIYYYRVKAYDSKSALSGSYSNTVKAVVPPQKVSGLSATNVKGSTVTLKWNKVANATGYKLYYYTAANGAYKAFATTTSNTYNVRAMTPNTAYKFKIKAYRNSDTAVYGAASNALSVKTTVDDVTKFSMTKCTAKGYILSWSKVSGITGYQLQRFNESTGKWQNSLITTATSVTVKNSLVNTATKFRIRTYIKSGNNYIYGVYTPTIVARRLPDVPENLKGTANTDNSITLTWTAVDGATGYNIYSYSAQDGTWTTAGSTTKNSFTAKNLNQTDTYRYAVSAYVDLQGKKYSSERCESVSVMFKSDEESNEEFTQWLEKNGILGYLFDPKEMCFYTSADPWQRVIGYNEIFDILGPYTMIDYDTMRLRFPYGDKDWMIQLWKGQYGLVFYGAEIGVYTKPKDRNLMHYDAASDDEMLQMTMTLLRKETGLLTGTKWVEKFSRPYGYYWWCTGFLPGNMYGHFEDLKMDVRITMKDYEMLSGVTAALKENNISYTVQGLDVKFVYA